MPAIQSGQSIYELGCGTGAVFQHLRKVYAGSDFNIGGSDLSGHAIEKIRQVFPNDKQHFTVLSMTQRNDKAQWEILTIFGS